MATGLLEVKPDMVEKALELYLESKTGTLALSKISLV